MPIHQRLDGNTACASLTSLPVEILAEVLLHTRSPPTVLAVARTCSFLYRSLVQNPDASFIWRRVRKTYLIPLPDPGDGWKKSEADYVAFVFGGGVCEVCQKATRAMYVSFSARIRLCGSWYCRRKFISDHLINVTSNLYGQDHWVPPVESTRCLYPARVGALIWPQGEILLRKSDWLAFQREFQAYGEAQAESKRASAPPASVTEEDEQRVRFVKWCLAATQRLPQIMETSISLVRWKWTHDQVHKIIKLDNDVWTKDLAESEGWNLEDLVASQAYGTLQRRKTFLLERMKLSDVTPIRSAIESELVSMQARHKRQKAEATYREKLTELKKMYERMRCGTLKGFDEPLVLPPLSVFCTLPSVRALKGSPDPSALLPNASSVSDDINSSLAISLITTDIHNWLVPVQKRLMTLLGYPNGWQSASTRTVPPLKRTTARFFCRRCGEGKVSKAYQRQGCLDFKGVCSHVCMSRKTIEGRQEASEESDVANTNGEDRGKKGSDKTSTDWTVDVFDKDEKAISLIKTTLKITGLSEENPIVTDALEAMGFSIRCMTCKGWIVMDFDTAIGHAHRHESMQIELLPSSAPRCVGFLKKDASAPVANTHRLIPATRLQFTRGYCDLLLGRSYHGRNLCKKVNYGCKHCFIVIDTNMVVAIEKAVKGKGPRPMDFNALRSHVKEKHGIQEIRDEDFFCYTDVEGEKKEA